MRALILVSLLGCCGCQTAHVWHDCLERFRGVVPKEDGRMLVLSRNVDERIVLSHPDIPGGTIELLITEVRGGKVKIGVSADRQVKIARKEILDADVPAVPGSDHSG